MPDALGWLVLGAAALVASTVGGVAGFGTAVTMGPLLAWVPAIRAAVRILTVAMLIGNGARAWFSRTEVQGPVVAAFLAGSLPMTVVGGARLLRPPRRRRGRGRGGVLLV